MNGAIFDDVKLYRSITPTISSVAAFRMSYDGSQATPAARHIINSSNNATDAQNALFWVDFPEAVTRLIVRLEPAQGSHSASALVSIQSSGQAQSAQRFVDGGPDITTVMQSVPVQEFIFEVGDGVQQAAFVGYAAAGSTLASCIGTIIIEAYANA